MGRKDKKKKKSALSLRFKSKKEAEEYAKLLSSEDSVSDSELKFGGLSNGRRSRRKVHPHPAFSK